MFIYNLHTREIESGSLTGYQPIDNHKGDSTQASPDAVIMVWPYLEIDTFSFETFYSNPMGVEDNSSTTTNIADLPSDEILKLGAPFLLDPMALSVTVRSAKGSHQDSLEVLLKDPNNLLLSIVNPGDWVLCWMFDNMTDSRALRNKLSQGKYTNLNSFNSGLKFIGKCLAPRRNDQVNPQGGHYTKSCVLHATAFSELDAQIYYDPQMNMNAANGFQFVSEIASVLNNNFNGIPRSVNGILGTLLPVFLGKPPRAGSQATPNSALRVPKEIGSLLGFDNAQTYMDVLNSFLGIQKYKDSYVPDYQVGIDTVEYSGTPLLPGQSVPVTINTHDNIVGTGKGLTGAVYPQIAPFNNVPIWSLLEQHLIPVANEMYSCLRMSKDGEITPHLIFRQIPFNTNSFVQKSQPDYTAFLELPRWKVEAPDILTYDTGKSNNMRVNYVQIQISGGLGNAQYLQAAQRAATIPRWDAVDIARHGLRPFIAQVNGTYELNALEAGQKWTDMVTDRLMGSHLKLSGSISMHGVFEPICVGDNLQYDGFVYHIESLEHRLVINPQTGQKDFTTNLAISHGVPATGPVLPEIAIRQFESSISTTASFTSSGGFEIPGIPTSVQSQTLVTSIKKGKQEAFIHSINPASNAQEDA